MFQYTKETVLNNPEIVVVEGVTNPYTLKEGVKKYVIKGVGEYFEDCMSEVFVTKGYEGKEGSLEFMESMEDKFAAVGQYMLTFRVVTPNQFLAEYASPAFKDFCKPMVIGFEVKKEKEGLAPMMEAIKLAIPADNQFIKIEGNKLMGTSNYMTFDKVVLEHYDPTTCDHCEGEYIRVELEAGVDFVIEKNVESFATGQWILENLRFPTYPNIRYASASTQMPVMGEVYTEYAFTYSVPRVGLGGLSGVGQAMDAVTRHIFFVPSAKEFKIGTEHASVGVAVKDVDGVKAVPTVDQAPKAEDESEVEGN